MCTQYVLLCTHNLCYAAWKFMTSKSHVIKLTYTDHTHEESSILQFILPFFGGSTVSTYMLIKQLLLFSEALIVIHDTDGCCFFRWLQASAIYCNNLSIHDSLSLIIVHIHAQSHEAILASPAGRVWLVRLVPTTYYAWKLDIYMHIQVVNLSFDRH